MCNLAVTFACPYTYFHNFNKIPVLRNMTAKGIILCFPPFPGNGDPVVDVRFPLRRKAIFFKLLRKNHSPLHVKWILAYKFMTFVCLDALRLLSSMFFLVYKTQLISWTGHRDEKDYAQSWGQRKMNTLREFVMTTNVINILSLRYVV